MPGANPTSLPSVRVLIFEHAVERYPGTCVFEREADHLTVEYGSWLAPERLRVPYEEIDAAAAPAAFAIEVAESWRWH